jgi:hypothetical protein
MEGYSVTEAASVLGVPTERVWELLARGVLVGKAEGESGMRVFLQPRAPSAPSRMEMPPPAAQPEREPERELSPFRELLTEFRNLTERYGQALLALGEARGEVASLRSRVDLLEARMDLRLPMAAAVAGSPSGWEVPAPPVIERPPARPPDRDDAFATDRRDAEPSHEAGSLDIETAQAPPEETDEAAERHRRRRGSHRATDRFAEALARAEDPTVPELPEPHREPHPDPTAGLEAGLPRETPVAEPMPTLDDVAPMEAETLTASASVGSVVIQEEDLEPEQVMPVDAEAPGDEVELDAGAAAAHPQVEAEAIIAVPDGALAEPSESRAIASEREQIPVDEEGSAGFAPHDEWAEPVEPWVEAAERIPAADDEIESRPGTEPQPIAEESAASLSWDPQRYTTAIGEPDWYAEEGEDVGATVLAGDATVGPDRTGPESPADDVPSTSIEPEGAGEQDEADGASEMEVAASAQSADGAADDEVPAPADPAEDALSALDALGRSAGGDPEPAPPQAWARPNQAAGGLPAPIDPVTEYRSITAGTVRPTTTPATPATRAYRRLRRIFPG